MTQATDEQEQLRRAGEVLNRLPRVTLARWEFRPTMPRVPWRPDAIAHLNVAHERHRVVMEFVRTLRALGAGAWIEHARALEQQAKLPIVMVTPYCAPKTAERLVKAEMNFVDLAGNVFLKFGNALLVVQGRKPPKGLANQARGEGNPLAAPGATRVVYVLLARPAHEWRLVDLARTAGVALGWTGTIVKAMGEAGLVRRIRARGPVAVVARDALFDRWLAGYAGVLRHQLVLGTYAPLGAAIDEMVEQWKGALTKHADGTRAALGGVWGADALVRFYRGPEAVVHVDGPARLWVERLHVVPDERGPITLVAPPGPELMWEDAVPTDRGLVAPPLVLYAELLADPDPRAQQLAEQLAQRYPELRRGH